MFLFVLFSELKIIFVFQDFPNEIIHCSGNALQMCFMQSIKEADQLKHDSKIINSMKPDEHIQLWNGVLHGFILSRFLCFLITFNVGTYLYLIFNLRLFLTVFQIHLY